MEQVDEEALKDREGMIIREYSGIFPAYEAFYIHSIIYAAERSEAAFQRFDDAVVEKRAAASVVATIQEALAHASALSRFFWPVKKDSALAKARGSRLRVAFAVDDSSALKWRKLRNSFEHFDEDLDRFLLHDLSGCFFPAPLVGDQMLAQEAAGNIFKLVDPNSGTCIILGDQYEFRPIRIEVQRVLSRAQEMDSQGCRL